MPSNAISSHGTLIKKGDGATPETFATVAEVKDIEGPDIDPQYEDVTNHGSGGWTEMKPVLKDGGKLSFPVNFLFSEPTHGLNTGLVADMLNGTRRNWKMVFPDNTTANFAAYVKVKLGAKVKGILEGEIELQLTGAVTFS